MIKGVSSGPEYLVDRDGFLSEERRNFFLFYQNTFFTKKQGNQALFSEQHFLSFYLRLSRTNAKLFMNGFFRFFYPDEQEAIFQMLFPKPMDAVYQQMDKYDTPALEMSMKRKFAFCYLYGEHFDSSIFQRWQETVCVEDKYRWIPLLPILDRNYLLTQMPFEKILDCLQNLPKVESARILCQLFEGKFLASGGFYAPFYASWREAQNKIYVNPLEAPAYRLIPFFPTHIQVYMCWASVSFNYPYNLSGIINHLGTLPANDASHFAEGLLSPPPEEVNEKGVRHFDTQFVRRLQELTETAQFNQLLNYLSTDNLLQLLRTQNMPASLTVLSERMKHKSDSDKQKFIEEQLLNFCYIRGQFDFKRFNAWYQKLPQSTQPAVFEMMPSQLQIAVFHYDRQACIEPLHQQVCQQDGVEQQNECFQEIFSFCFNQGIFNLSAFRDWQRYAHPVEKYRWEDFAYRFTPTTRLGLPRGAVSTAYSQNSHGDSSLNPQGLHFAYPPKVNSSVTALTDGIGQLGLNEFSPPQTTSQTRKNTKGNRW